MADEDPTDGTMIVCTTTDDGIWSDNTTVLVAGCHSLIDKDCTVVYGEAIVMDANKVSALRRAVAQSGPFRFDPNEKLNNADLQRVQDGFGDKNGIALEQRDLKVAAHEYAKKRGII